MSAFNAAMHLLLGHLRARRPIFPLVIIAFRILATAGPRGLTNVLVERHARRLSYAQWLALNESPERSAARLEAIVASRPLQPTIAVLMPVYDPPVAVLEEAIESVRSQTYANWQLCIADDRSADPAVSAMLRHYAAQDDRINIVFRSENGHISRASNSALELVSADWVALLDHDDLLAPTALAEVMIAINDHPDAQIIYSDEDKLGPKGRYEPHFKPDFSRELFRSQNYLNHLTVHRTDNIRRVGGWRAGFEGRQDYDLSLRIFETIAPRDIIHIPKILYHWRAVAGSTALAASEKNYAYPAGLRALEQHLERTGSGATAEYAPGVPCYRVRPPIIGDPPLVTIIVPTRNGAALLRRCIDSILRLTTYAPYEILIIDNDSDDPVALALLSELAAWPNIRVVPFKGKFNYPALNNFAVSIARGSLLALVNSDIEVISPGWLSEMVAWASQPDIGCVGAKLYYPNGDLQHAGVIVGLGGVAGHSHKHLGGHQPGHFFRPHVIQNLSAVTAACLVVRKDIYEQVGGLDAANLPIAFNDVDFCLRVRAAGWNNVWTPCAELYHHESATRGTEDASTLARFHAEIAFMRSRWGAYVDPCYSPNLSLDREDFSIGPSRIPERVGITAIFKNECPYILEWVAYHRVLGVRDFFIAEDASTDGTTALLARLAARGLIEHIPVTRKPGEPPHLPAYAALMARFSNRVDWMAFIDADEFLLPSAGAATIAGALQAIPLAPLTGAFAINWAVYGSSHLEAGGPEPVIARFSWRAEADWTTNHHYKSIVRSSAYRDVGRNPHYFVLRPEFVTANVNGQPIVHHEISVGLSRDVVWVPLRLNHYVIKSAGEFLTNKKNKGDASSDAIEKAQAYFDHHDRNDVLDPMPAWLLDATRAEMQRIAALLG